MSFTQTATLIFNRAITDYHISDNILTTIHNPYPDSSIEGMLYLKCWIDTVQWHYEDIIRDPNINPEKGMKLKHMIDKSNQERTDLVEQIDSYFLNYYKEVKVEADAQLNTESPAWAIDRLSILALKIYHMKEQAERKDASEEHRNKCRNKLEILLEQQRDLSQAIDQLLQDIQTGKKRMKVYRQMKMYNDADTNPILYQHEKRHEK